MSGKLQELAKLCGCNAFGNADGNRPMCKDCMRDKNNLWKVCLEVKGIDVLMVYHKRKTDFWTVPKEFERSDYQLVASVAGGWDLEKAYMMTNSFENPWWDNDDLHVVRDKTRSTSVGDVIAKGGYNRPTQYYAVDRIGFKLIGEA